MTRRERDATRRGVLCPGYRRVPTEPSGESRDGLDYDRGMGLGSENACRLIAVVFGCLLVVLSPRASLGQERPAEPPSALAPEQEQAELTRLIGRRIARIEVVFDDPLWSSPVTLTRVRVGQTFTPEIARRALDELADSGRFGELAAEVEPSGGGVLLRLRVLARRVVAAVRVSGVGEVDDLLRAANIRTGTEVTARELGAMVQRLELELGRRGYPHARARIEPFDTDAPLGTVLAFDVTPGAAARIAERRFFVWPDPDAPKMSTLLKTHEVGRGALANLEAIETESRELEQVLRAAGYFDARVEHELVPIASGFRLNIRVYAGSFVRIRFEGNRHFDARDLVAALGLELIGDRSPPLLVERIREFYVQRGFFDIEVNPLLRGEVGAPIRDLILRVNEGNLVRVVAREFPCLSGERSADEVGSEIDSFLSELPGGTLIDAVDPANVNALFGPKQASSRRKKPLFLVPWTVYSPEVYDRAMEHLQDLYRSEGYLSASVGPVTVVRRTCDVRSPPGKCIARKERARPSLDCKSDSEDETLAEAELDPELSCKVDRARGVYCEPDALLSIPVRLGPRSFIQSVEMDGNSVLPERVLVDSAALQVGSPVSQLELDQARSRLLDLYAEEGFAFSEVEVDLELSPDRQHAKVRFVISERKQVRVSRVVVRGARITSESVIRGRISLVPGDLYRRSLVRTTEERLGTLGVFSSVTVGLEDPYVPASQKVVIVTVSERKPQYLDVRPGFSTGEGFRITFEYGHRNLGGQAIQLTLRSQLGFLPSALILEDAVRRKYEELDALDRLERRNTASIEFPEIGLGPLFRLRVEGVDVRDNARDYGLTKDAGILSLFFLPERRLWFELGASLERNDASIFGQENKQSLDEYIRNNINERNAFRVPEGPTVVLAERLGATWDRRDSPLDATSGTFISAGLEHVTARPIGRGCPESATGSVFAPACSDFLRFTNRVAGYLRLSRRGLALAASFRWGMNHQLTDRSRTYPDRLFFLGGVDSLRGFLQEALVPEDVATQLLRDETLDLNQIVIRGGDVFVNPRLELRIPLGDGIQTAVFLDSGNLWTDPNNVDVFKLRYAVGTGLRVGTPVGPLVFDYGFNVDRVLDAFELSDRPERYWEDLGAFHFSIGLF